MGNKKNAGNRTPRRYKGGRPKAFVTVRLPIATASALVDWLMEHQPPDDHPARRGWDFLTAGLWSEVSKSEQHEGESS